MDSETKFTVFICFIIINILLLIWSLIPLYFGYQSYIQFPKTQQETQCRVQQTDVMKWTFIKFQAIWTVVYNDSDSEKVSKIFLSNFTTFTDALEVTMNQYKIGEVYKCYFNKKKSYDLLWTFDDKLNQGKQNLIMAFIFGILILILWTLPIGYFCYKCYKKLIVNPYEISSALK